MKNVKQQEHGYATRIDVNDETHQGDALFVAICGTNRDPIHFDEKNFIYNNKVPTSLTPTKNVCTFNQLLNFLSAAWAKNKGLKKKGPKDSDDDSEVQEMHDDHSDDDDDIYDQGEFFVSLLGVSLTINQSPLRGNKYNESFAFPSVTTTISGMGLPVIAEVINFNCIPPESNKIYVYGSLMDHLVNGTTMGLIIVMVNGPSRSDPSVKFGLLCSCNEYGYQVSDDSGFIIKGSSDISHFLFSLKVKGDVFVAGPILYGKIVGRTLESTGTNKTAISFGIEHQIEDITPATARLFINSFKFE